MFKKKFFNSYAIDKLLILALFFLSLLINQYYGNRGVFPIDTFLHFDTGYRVLNGEHPVKDYWVVSGIFLDYLQAIFFYILGANWKSYVFHASLFNGLLTITTYIVLRNFNLEKKYSFLYSLSFSILAYPSSGTPFVDHHSAFFSLIGIYLLILAIKKKNNLYLFFLPMFLSFAFLSKQVPSSYVILSVCFTIFIYSIIKKNFSFIKYPTIGLLFIIIIILVIGKFFGISFSSFLDQYIFYPKSVGSDRFVNLDLNFNNVISNYKFIYISILPLIIVNLKSIFSSKNYLQNDYFFFFLILILFTISLIFHQLLTKNQIFIFFLIPVLTAFSQIYIKNYNYKNKNFVFILILLICLFSTTKYHYRFNENRKFHDLQGVNFNLSINAKKLNKSLSGLNWITAGRFTSNPENEISFIKDIQKVLHEDKRNKMVMTNYLFFSVISKEKLYSPSRTFTLDGASFPIKDSKYFLSYKKFVINIIKKNKISVIYIIDSEKIDNKFVYNYINKNCFNEVSILKQLKSYELKNCDEING